MAPRYDTVAVGGTASETNPLLIYRQPVGIQLIDETTVLYADNAGGRLIAVDLLSGQGWEIDDGGSSGPGEFGGMIPFFSESGGRIFTATFSGQMAVFSLRGELLETGRFPEVFFGPGGAGVGPPSGFLAPGYSVSLFQAPLDGTTTGPQTLTRDVRAQSVSEGIVWVHSDLAPVVQRVEEQGGGRWHSVPISGEGIGVDARHSTVALAQNHDTWLRVLDPHGRLKREVQLPYEAFLLFVDANERIWVQVWARNSARTGSYLVYDTNLELLFRVTERNIQDAFGDYIVTIGRDDTEAILLYLLKRGLPTGA